MHKDKSKNALRILVIVLSCCLAAFITIAVLLHSLQPPSLPPSSTTTPSIEKNPDSIAIPGYELLELQSGRRKQTLCLPNPEQNMCYFQISLYLADGTLLWQSELIEPGNISKPMVLTAPLEKGTYSDAILKYACFRMDESLSPLNGAQTKVTLWVK